MSDLEALNEQLAAVNAEIVKEYERFEEALIAALVRDLIVTPGAIVDTLLSKPTLGSLRFGAQRDTHFIVECSALYEAIGKRQSLLIEIARLGEPAEAEEVAL